MSKNQPAAPWLAAMPATDPAATTAASTENSATAAATADAGTTPLPNANDTPAVLDAQPAAPAVQEIAPVAQVEKVSAEVVDMVTVTVPKPFILRVDNFTEKKYAAGVQEMERSHAEHWYAKAYGVVIYQPKA